MNVSPEPQKDSFDRSSDLFSQPPVKREHNDQENIPSSVQPCLQSSIKNSSKNDVAGKFSLSPFEFSSQVANPVQSAIPTLSEVKQSTGVVELSNPDPHVSDKCDDRNEEECLALEVSKMSVNESDKEKSVKSTDSSKEDKLNEDTKESPCINSSPVVKSPISSDMSFQE